MDDDDCDSTWEEEEEEEDQEKEKDERKTREEAKPRQQQRGNQAFQPRWDSLLFRLCQYVWQYYSFWTSWVSLSLSWGYLNQQLQINFNQLKNRMIGGRNWRAVQDMQRYRRRYPGLTDNESNDEMLNLKFYKNEIAFLPNGYFIEDILKNWKEDYDILEDNHSYIQWLFPLRERGVNWHAKPLTLREIQEFKKSAEVMRRFVQAYELILGFYGIELENHKTGKVRKADNYQERFQNLNSHSHNNLRITRILKCLGEMGYEHYQVPLIRFFLEEILVNRCLPSVKQSALDYFMFTVRNKKERRKLVYYAWKNFNPQYKFVWGPHEKLQRFESGQQDCLEEEGSGVSQNDVGIEKDQVRTQVREEIVGDGVTSKDKQMGKKNPSARLQSCEMKKGERLNSSDQKEEKVATKNAGDQAPRPQSPKESKKRKYEVNRLEFRQEEQGQGTSDVEKIAHNLEECALGQSELRTSRGSKEMGSLDLPRERGPSSPESMEIKMYDEVNKRRRIESKAPKNHIETAKNVEQTPICFPIPNGIPHEAEKTEDKSNIRWEAKSLQAKTVKHDNIPVASSGNPSGDPSSINTSPEQSDLQEYVHIEKRSVDTNPELKRPDPGEAAGAECSDGEVPQKAGDETTVERPYSE
ncbi:opioid growth factor receptor isoform X1 [Vombatus ursinus]|uniref:Opioid growth factor receptor (OGFr) conserved domain-containing protein n=1 Tax=Vombatus ursinus TaxID=29139 RepID=A0A4X2LDY9_VOMUR|nr:opioid growth factor receptor isoform X1 [Vombatus ursinus]